MKKGEVYLIRNKTLDNRPVVEGEARLVKKISREDETHDAEMWQVEFLTEPGTIWQRIVLTGDRIE